MKTHLIDGHKIWLTYQELEIFAALWNARGAIVSTETIAYSINTNANDANQLVRLVICAMRAKFAPTRFRIENFRILLMGAML